MIGGGKLIKFSDVAMGQAWTTVLRGSRCDCDLMVVTGVNETISFSFVFLPKAASIGHADFDGIERLVLVTGGEIASTFDNPESVKLGRCDLIEEIMTGEDKSIKFSGVAMGQTCTIVLRGASHHVLDGAERSLHDALCVLSQTVNDSRVLLGGGWPEMVMAKEVDALARKTPGKKSLAMEAFSHALFAIPTAIADNAGLDSAELISQIREEHQNGRCTTGMDVISGSVGMKSTVILPRFMLYFGKVSSRLLAQQSTCFLSVFCLANVL
ncbi:T-complex protein 1 subunit beta-like isoform X1 [Cicer arietinum]|uniref:T-complex protein 1 subunit beta-like isoform X2 n=1 Tax=Cicer arietinum TaxID=3827 RepID=A0A1S3DZT7_CICAR|nr:T-complex protein 1 subunit beta-like isoform X2 [Cicer arietinum]